LPVGWTPENTRSTKAMVSFQIDLFGRVVCHAGLTHASRGIAFVGRL
jgi:hypothetical protein